MESFNIPHTSKKAQSINNNREYKFVGIQPHSPSFMMNNLTSNDGDSYAYVNSVDGQHKAVIYPREVIENNEASAPVLF